MPKKTNPTTLQQAIIRYEVSTSNSYPSNFRFILRTDGSGILQDLDYQEELEIVHTIDLENYAESGEIKLAPIEATPPPRDGVHSLSELEREVGYDDEIYEAIQDLFTENNDALENPVGDPPDDSDLTLERGTEEELYKSIAAVSYLARLAGYNDVIECTSATHEDGSEQQITDWTEIDERLHEIVLAVLNAFNPRASSYNYVDQNDGRVTAYAASGEWIQVGPEQVAEYFPSARERLESKAWLREMFTSMEIDTNLIDTTFPIAI
jgi:hypothetical protein